MAQYNFGEIAASAFGQGMQTAQRADQYARSEEAERIKTQKAFELEEQKMSAEAAFREMQMDKLNEQIRIATEERRANDKYRYDTLLNQRLANVDAKYIRISNPNSPYLNGRTLIQSSELEKTHDVIGHLPVGQYMDKDEYAGVLAMMQTDRMISAAKIKADADKAEVEAKEGVLPQKIMQQFIDTINTSSPFIEKRKETKNVYNYSGLNTMYAGRIGSIAPMGTTLPMKTEETEAAYLDENKAAQRLNALAALVQMGSDIVTRNSAYNNNEMLKQAKLELLSTYENIAPLIGNAQLPIDKTTMLIIQALLSERGRAKSEFDQRRIFEEQKALRGVKDEDEQKRIKEEIDKTFNSNTFNDYYNSLGFMPFTKMKPR